MSREIFVVMMFGAAVLEGLFDPTGAVLAGAGLTATAFLVCQAMILWRARGIPAWRHPLIPWMIGATGLFEGLGLLVLVFLFQDRAELLSPLATVGALLAALNLGLWQAYRRSAKAQGIPPLSRQVLARIERLLLPAGQAAPLVLFVLSMLIAGPAGSIALALAGLLAIAGGAYWKFMIVARASHQQGFAMPKMPHRGSGTRAAPPRMQGTTIRPAKGD